MLSTILLLFYNVGLTPGPIGNPVIYHPIINNIHVADISKKYGVIICSDFLIVYGLSLCKLYTFKYPIYITKDASNGVNPFVIESPALITICANCGDIFDCMNIGTTTGENIIHLLVEDVSKKLDNAISIKLTKISGIPLNDRWFNNDANHVVTTIPILLFLNTAIN